MAYSWTFYRDSLVLDQSFKGRVDKELQINKVPTGTTLLLAARYFRVAPGYIFELVGYHITVLADRLDGAAGTIQVTGLPSQYGGAGSAGPNVVVACRELAGIRLRCDGGRGGDGLQGETGWPGNPGRSYPNKPGGPGGPGGKGGNGYPGGDGGQGGNIELFYMEDKVPGGFNANASLDVSGGTGGTGGPGGFGGSGGAGGAGGTYTSRDPVTGETIINSFPDGPDGPDGPLGDPGPVGRQGNAGSFTYSQLSEADFWQRIGPYADRWAQYRLRMGEYYFRAFNPNTAPDYITIALGEFNAVVSLDPGNVQARDYRERILNNQNIFGLARDIDIIPDFDMYGKVVTDYSNLVLPVFQAAKDMFLTDATLEQMRNNLSREIANMTGMIASLKNDLDAARINKMAMDSAKQLAVNRVQRMMTQVNNAQGELNARYMELGSPTGQPFRATIGVVANAVLAVFTGGKSLLSIIPTILDNGQEDTTIADIIKSKEKRDQLQQMAGGIKELAGAVDVLFSFPKMLNDAVFSRVDAASEAYKKLVVESLDLVHGEKIAELRLMQADLLQKAVEARLQAVNTDLALANVQFSGLKQETKYLEEVARNLIRTGQRYMDILITYYFLAARAVEIYTNTEQSDQIYYDFGYIHPEQEDELSLVELAGEYTRSWTRIGQLLSMKDMIMKYDRVFTGLSHDDLFLAFSDPAAIANFRETLEFVFTVDLNDLPSDRYQAKTERVTLALVGAQAQSDTISCIVEHSGRCYVKKKVNITQVEVLNVVLSPARTVITAAKAQGQYSGGVSGQTPNKDCPFWGRSVAATWHIYIEPDVVIKQQVDLSGLSAIQVKFGFSCLLE